MKYTLAQVYSCRNKYISMRIYDHHADLSYKHLHKFNENETRVLPKSSLGNDSNISVYICLGTYRFSRDLSVVRPVYAQEKMRNKMNLRKKRDEIQRENIKGVADETYLGLCYLE